MKTLAGRDGGRILGTRLMGPNVSGMMPEGQLVVGRNAEPVDVARHRHAHSTLREAVGETYLTLAGRGLHQR
ncbi:hypothetical protein [Streptomyces sp. VRA16 Mangrove soil]|uniref:hypothetical protein n=1 Tax=Streptomyces sp. VRA16 Mangrove soil TaxID=2817434 RepID=UPI0027DE6032|nr:hypothetical protein [Streptomyces sp. VRA16 Mangrove soil]